jgi:PIN domain nuclease of toxin-antitoxin system
MVSAAMKLLDTGPLIYFLHGMNSLPPKTRIIIEKSRDSLAVSAVSIFEVRSKAARGTWRAVRKYAHADMVPFIEDRGIEILPMTGDIADRAADFMGGHGDPFDRFILATAWKHRADLVSEDEPLDRFAWDGYNRIW